MILFDLTAVFLLLFLFLFSFANPEYQKYEEQVAPLLVSGDTSTEYDLAPTLREFCGGYGLANFRWDGIMTSIMTSLPYFWLKLSCVSLMFADRKKSNDL